MAEQIAIGYPAEATSQQARDEVSGLTKRPNTARAIIRNREGTIWVATNPTGWPSRSSGECSWGWGST